MTPLSKRNSCSRAIQLVPFVAAALISFAPLAVGQEPTLASSQSQPVQLTAKQDHQRLLNLLHIETLRRGPDGDPKSPNAANFDESKVRPYSLPDPLQLKNGTKVTTSAQWWNLRRPEIVEDFDREIYGRVPANAPRVKWTVTATTNGHVGYIPAITKNLVGHVDNSAYPLINVDIEMTLTVPTSAPGPVPVMLEFGPSPEVLAAIRKRFTDAQWAAYNGTGPSWQQQVLAQGWGYAILIPTSIQADNGEGLTQGIIGLTNRGQPRKLDDWGALRAWAWGASRALDYFETDSSVDASQVGIEGLSRYGKAALVAMAYDSRFAIGFIGSSGEGGAKILRRTFGEQVENIASSSEYHWMAGNFLKYAGPLTPDDLPVDAHELIALCAPRPVFISSGSQQVEGGWVDAKGMFLGAMGAGPVYRLLGKKALETTAFPPMETALIDGDIAFRQHKAGHTTGPNWPMFLDFAGHYIKAEANEHWLGTWAASPQLGDSGNAPPDPGLANVTLRQLIRVSVGGRRIIVRFSNAFGRTPLTISSAHVALSPGGGTIRPESDRALLFNGQRSVTIPAGALINSDPLNFDLPPLSDLAITIYLPTAPDGITTHPGSRTTSYLQAGDAVTAMDMTDAAKTYHWYFINGVDVLAPSSAASVVILGDSITDGRGSITNGNGRWPDYLARRLHASESTTHVAVLNQGIGGNRLLHDGLGPNALARLDRDALAQSGVRWLIVFEGINDLGTRPNAAEHNERPVSAADMISAYRQIIHRGHVHDLRVYGVTILACEGSSYFNPVLESDRLAINKWIRTSGEFDAVIDLDAATRDPVHPSRLLPAFDSGDHLHPGDAGYRAMGDAVELTLFSR